MRPKFFWPGLTERIVAVALGNLCGGHELGLTFGTGWANFLM